MPQPRTARPVKWIAVEEHGCFIARVWTGHIVVAPMNADGSRATDRLEQCILDPIDNADVYDRYAAIVGAPTAAAMQAQQVTPPRSATRAEQHERYIDAGPSAWDDIDG